MLANNFEYQIIVKLMIVPLQLQSLKVLTIIPYFKFHFFPYMPIFLHLGTPPLHALTPIQSLRHALRFTLDPIILSPCN